MFKDGFIKINCKGIDYVDSCPRKIVPKISASNFLFWQFFQKISPGLQNNMGGFNIAPVKELLDVYSIPEGQRAIFYDRLFIVLGVINGKKTKT